MRIVLHTVTEVTFYNLDLAIPEDVKAQGEDAIVKWANDNLGTVNGARGGHTESQEILKVNGVQL